MNVKDCVIFDEGFVIIDDNEIVCITNWYDEDGIECEADEATQAVAGPTMSGQWIRIEILSQDRPTRH